jgi:hypothetical protein
MFGNGHSTPLNSERHDYTVKPSCICETSVEMTWKNYEIWFHTCTTETNPISPAFVNIIATIARN